MTYNKVVIALTFYCFGAAVTGALCLLIFRRR